MKTLEFIYQDTEVHFLLNPSDENVMVNATEMAKAFGKRIDVFLKSQGTKDFIKALENQIQFPPNGGNSDFKIIQTKGQAGTFFERRLALKFAAWLDVEFELWIYNTIDEILFGHYRQHWKAHAMQEEAKAEMQRLRKELLLNPTTDLAREYFENESKSHNAKVMKRNAIRHQLKLFN